jgi:hypothetical protein
MNNLSIWIYLATIFDNVKTVIVSSIVLSFIAIIIGMMIVLLSASNDQDEKIIENNIKYTKFSIGVFLVSVFLAIFIPTKETVMMVVASQYSEKILTSQTAQSLADPSVELLKAWIQKQTKSLNRE